MRATVAFAAAVVLASTMMAGRAAAESPVTLTVRLYNASAIPARELVTARRAADSILRDAGLDVIFRHCGRPVTQGDPIDACDEPLKPSEVVVRAIDAPAFNTTLHPEAFGVAYVVQDTDRGWLATVFPDRINRAATRAGVESGTLLGRVIAHEVGHLLLGNRYHGKAGVMRADWPDALLNRTGEEWRFSVIEAARIHQLLASIVSNPLAPAATF